jgi:hypothetical protein
MFDFLKKKDITLQQHMLTLDMCFNFYVSLFDETFSDFSLDFKVFVKNDFYSKIIMLDSFDEELLKESKNNLVPQLQIFIKHLKGINKNSYKRFIYLFTNEEIEKIKNILIKIYSL